jgi:hypothetical protein
MRYLKIVFLLTIFSVSSKLYAQTELELKTTGKYLFSWSYENNEAIARESAKAGLLDTIFVSLLREPAIDQTDTVFIKVIHYFVKKVGFKWQAIAFADKSDIKIKLEQRKEMKVIPVIIGESSEPSDKNKVQPEATEKVQVISTGNISGGKSIAKTGNQILDKLIAISDAQSLEQLLIKYSSELKLNYGDKSIYPDDSGCYIFVIDKKTLKIMAVYDKGKGSRRDLLTDATDNNYTEKFKGNHFVYVLFN